MEAPSSARRGKRLRLRSRKSRRPSTGRYHRSSPRARWERGKKDKIMMLLSAFEVKKTAVTANMIASDTAIGAVRFNDCIDPRRHSNFATPARIALQRGHLPRSVWRRPSFKGVMRLCDQDHSALGNLLLWLSLHRRDGRCVTLAIGRCPVALSMGVTQTKGVTDESSTISNSRSARTNNHRRKRLHASPSQTSRSRADCSARSSGPKGHQIYGDLEGHDCEIGKAKA